MRILVSIFYIFFIRYKYIFLREREVSTSNLIQKILLALTSLDTIYTLKSETLKLMIPSDYWESVKITLDKFEKFLQGVW